MTAALTKLEKELEALNESIDSGEFVPKSTGGKQHSPNMIRGQIRKFLIENPMTQSAFLSLIGVNSNSYGKFMDAKYYKNEWSAVDNGTYNSAAQYIAVHSLTKKIKDLQMKADTKASDKILGKRSVDDISGDSASVSASTTNKQTKAVAVALVNDTIKIDVPDSCAIYQNCDEVRKALEVFFQTSGINKETN
jgi:hypothetical protein